MSRTKYSEHQRQGRYRRWIELDPVQSKVWRYAWDLLLEDRYSLEEICDALHARGYTRRGGTPFVKILPNGKREHYLSALSAAFHNPFYAGLIYVHDYFDDEEFQVVKAEWEGIVTPEEFEVGIAILRKRDSQRTHRPKHFYLLQGMLYLQQPDGSLIKLTCSTPNANRKRGGVSYYCVASSRMNFLCYQIDSQVAKCLHAIQVDPQRLPGIQGAYTADIARHFQVTPEENETMLQTALDEIRQEEANAARLHAKGKMADEVYEELWREWQDRRNKIGVAMNAPDGLNTATHVETLDAALKLIAKAGIIFDKLEVSRKRDLLRYLIEQIVINLKGQIVSVKLRPPFSYLHSLSAWNAGTPDGEDGLDITAVEPTKLDQNRTSRIACDSAGFAFVDQDEPRVSPYSSPTDDITNSSNVSSCGGQLSRPKEQKRSQAALR